MRRSMAVAGCLIAVLLAPLVTGGSASAVVPGTNGRILYTRAIFRSMVSLQLEAADPDGTNITVLANFPGDAFGDEMFANWSPDARTVILNIDNAIWKVNADGTDLHELISCSSPGVYCPRLRGVRGSQLHARRQAHRRGTLLYGRRRSVHAERRRVWVEGDPDQPGRGASVIRRFRRTAGRSPSVSVQTPHLAAPAR